MAFRFSERSERRLHGVHPDMVRVMRRALELSPVDFTVVEGLRSLQRQHELYASGASKTMNSRHLTGHGVDIAPVVDGSVSWHWPHYYDLADVVKQAAADCGVTLEWGGDWTSFKDGPHWQLPWDQYPADSYDASRAGAASAAAIDPDSLRADPDAVVEENRDRTGVAAAGATAAGGGVAVSAALDLRENEGAAAAEAQAAASQADAANAGDAAETDASSDAPAETSAEGVSDQTPGDLDTSDAAAPEAPTQTPELADAAQAGDDAPAQEAPTEDAPAEDLPPDAADASPEAPPADAAEATEETAADAAGESETAEAAAGTDGAADDTPDPADPDAAEGGGDDAVEAEGEAPADPAPEPTGEPADAAQEGAPAEAVSDTGEGAAGALAQARDLLDRFIASENTLEIIALVLGVVVVIFGLYLLMRRFIRWRRNRRAARRVNKVLGHA